jgi:hypothetical protein
MTFDRCQRLKKSNGFNDLILAEDEIPLSKDSLMAQILIGIVRRRSPPQASPDDNAQCWDLPQKLADLADERCLSYPYLVAREKLLYPQMPKTS